MDKENIGTFFEKNKWLVFLFIFLFVLGIRLYYFSLAKEQPLWWDESEYMASAKGYAGIIDFHVGDQRLPGFPFFVSLFYRLGIESEIAVRFLVAFLPSLIVIFLAYVCLSEMYDDKRVALISVLILSVLWEHVFYSNRFQTENMALIFQFLSFLIVFMIILKNKKVRLLSNWPWAWLIAFIILSLLMRPGNVFFVPALAIFLLIDYKSSIFKKENSVWIFSIAAIFLAAVFYVFFKLPREGLISYWHPEWPITLNPFTIFYGFYQSIIPPWPSVFFWLFIIGALATLLNVYFRWDTVKKITKGNTEINLKSDILNLLLIAIMMFITCFIMRASNFEYRWFFPLLTALLAFTSKGLIITYDFIRKNVKLDKNIVLIIVSLILLLGMYNQVIRADQIIKIKLDSYGELKEAGFWIKQNSEKDDMIFTYSQPQIAYYSERNVFPPGQSYQNVSDFENALEEYKPKYLVLSAFSQYLDWMQPWLDANQERVVISRVYTAKNNPNQPIVIIYELKS